MEAIRRYLEGDRFASNCDIKLLNVSPGAAKAMMVLSDKHLNGYGNVQGGAIFTLADYAFAAASNAHGTVAVGINVNISFVKAARTGTLIATASETSMNPKLATYTVHVTDDLGSLVAIFNGMVYRKSQAVPGAQQL